MGWAYIPYSLNGNVVDGSGNIFAWFEPENGPMATRPVEAVEATVAGLGDRDVRGQPKGTTWRLHCRLASVAESDLQAAYKVFDEEAGLVYLRADDGAATPARWRI